MDAKKKESEDSAFKDEWEEDAERHLSADFNKDRKK